MTTDGLLLIIICFQIAILVAYYNPENYNMILAIPNIIWVIYASVNLILSLT